MGKRRKRGKNSGENSNQVDAPLLFLIGSVLFGGITVGLRILTGSWTTTITTELLLVLAGLIYFYRNPFARGCKRFWEVAFVEENGLANGPDPGADSLEEVSQENDNQDGESAIIECPDCGSQVSKKAESCPDCGRPIKKTTGATGNVVAGIASFAIPGLGQLVQGRLIPGITTFFGFICLWIISLIGIATSAYSGSGVWVITCYLFGLSGHVIASYEAATFDPEKQHGKHIAGKVIGTLFLIAILMQSIVGYTTNEGKIEPNNTSNRTEESSNEYMQPLKVQNVTKKIIEKGRTWEISWIVEVENNTAEKKNIYVEVSFNDKNGFQMDYDNENTSIDPLSTKKITGVELVDEEKGKKIKNVTASVE